ncbi:MAG: PEP-CTERM sorting domain-containing protein [Sedimentisphaerales bacterium]|nr:PEP-CTERM sorting domain-containing protein [Sedimentisphaerales bacterium]
MRYVACLIILAAVASVAPAAISMSIAETDNSAVLGAGYVTNDILVTTDVDWSQSQVLVTLTAGSVYQTPTFGAKNPQPAWWGAVPALQYDSWVTDGSLGTCSYAGAAGNLGGDTEQWDTTHLDLCWFNTASGNTGTDLLNARITLSDDAQGTWAYCVWDAGDETIDLIYMDNDVYKVVDGHMIPEPATMAMLMLGGLGVLARRRRS